MKHRDSRWPNAQHAGQTHATCCAQQCCRCCVQMLRSLLANECRANVVVLKCCETRSATAICYKFFNCSLSVVVFVFPSLKSQMSGVFLPCQYFKCFSGFQFLVYYFPFVFKVMVLFPSLPLQVSVTAPIISLFFQVSLPEIFTTLTSYSVLVFHPSHGRFDLYCSCTCQ